MKGKLIVVTLILICLTGVSIVWMGGIQPEILHEQVKRLGIFAPIIYVLLYIVATILLLPSTPLNISGGLIFGFQWGLFWTAIAAIMAAIASFIYARFLGQNWVRQKFGSYLQNLDEEIRKGGIWYIFAIRLLPLIPYGIVNYGAGLTSVTQKDYLFGTIFGTIPGIFPFVMIGAGLAEGSILPVTIASGLAGLLLFGATWFKNKSKGKKH